MMMAGGECVTEREHNRNEAKSSKKKRKKNNGRDCE